MSQRTITTRDQEYRGCIIRRTEYFKTVYVQHGRNKGWRDRKFVRWTPYQSDGETFIKGSLDKGRTLRGAKKAIDKFIQRLEREEQPFFEIEFYGKDNQPLRTELEIKPGEEITDSDIQDALERVSTWTPWPIPVNPHSGFPHFVIYEDGKEVSTNKF